MWDASGPPHKRHIVNPNSKFLHCSSSIRHLHGNWLYYSRNLKFPIINHCSYLKLLWFLGFHSIPIWTEERKKSYGGNRTQNLMVWVPSSPFTILGMKKGSWMYYNLVKLRYFLVHMVISRFFIAISLVNSIIHNYILVNSKFHWIYIIICSNWKMALYGFWSFG